MTELAQTAKSPATVSFYETKVRHVVRLLGEMKLSSLHAHGYQRALLYYKRRTDPPPPTGEGEGAHKYTVHRELTALRLVLKSAIRAHEWSGDVDSVVPKVATGYEPLTDWVTPEQIWKTIEQLVSLERGATVAWCVATASDFSLLFDATRGDVLPHTIRVRGTKTNSRDRYVPRIPALEPFLAYALEHGAETGPLFPPWNKMARDLRAAAARAGVPGFTARTLRRSVATWLVRSNVPYEIAAKFLGHGSTTMLQKVYGQLAPEDAGRLIAERMSAAGDVPPVYPTPARTPEADDAEEAETTQNRSTEGTPHDPV